MIDLKSLWEEATCSIWPRPSKITAGEYDYHLIKFADLIIAKYAFVASCEYEADSIMEYDYLDDYHKGKDDCASIISAKLSRFLSSYPTKN